MLALFACAPVRNVVPLKQGSLALTGTFGGPAVGAHFWGRRVPAPLPLSSLSLAYGLTHATTLFTSIYPTAMSFGNLQVEAGSSLGLWESDVSPLRIARVSILDHSQIGISLQPAIVVLGNVWGSSLRVWPTLDAQLYVQYQGTVGREEEHRTHTTFDNSNYWYIGSCNWFELSTRLSGGAEVAHHWFPGVDIGHVLRYASVDLTTELRYLAIGIPNHNPLLDYQGIDEHGTFGMYLGVSWRSF